MRNKLHVVYQLGIALVVGVIVGAIFVRLDLHRYALLAAWNGLAITYVAIVWLIVGSMNAEETKSHAIKENPGRALADLLLLLASLASLGAVFVLIAQGDGTRKDTVLRLTIGLCSVIVAWLTVHTVHALSYARAYYGHPEGGIDFGNEKPKYSDFAYVAFTIGMTFQTSDTQLQTAKLRSIALKQALLSYAFGTAIIATTINAIASLVR